MDSVNDFYISVRERIFALLESEAIPQKTFAEAIKTSPQAVTDWKAGRNFSFMKKLRSIASALNTTEVWLLMGKDAILDDDSIQELERIADSLGVHPLDLVGIGGKLDQYQVIADNVRRKDGGEITPQETRPMNARLEIDPALLDDAVEVMRFAADICEADAAALARLDTPEARELAQARLLMAKKADKLLFFFAGQ